MRSLGWAGLIGFAISIVLSLFSWPAMAGDSAASKHWAFRPVSAPKPPPVADETWVKTDIDRFILTKLEARGLHPSPPADRRALMRRATFDLLGLPPTPEAMETFLADEAPGAFARLVDRLLESPQYGERWARHWLDVARYADNKGYVFFEEKTYPWAWTYRDYVVRAFNQDKPFDRFVLEQLAADQLDLGNDSRALAALGFLTVGDHFSNNTHDILDDRIDVVTRGLLGLTVGCARCHDHKFDPIIMSDYYALYGVFRGCTEPMVPPVIERPMMTELYEGFELELIARESKLRGFVESKHRDMVHGARTRIAEYLMAVYAQRHQPPTESFMLIADKEDLNPAVIARWRSYLERVGPTNAVWQPWLAFAALEETNFVEQAPVVHAALFSGQGKPERAKDRCRAEPLNARLVEAFEGPAPPSMKDVAGRYANVLATVNERWQEALESAARTSQPAPAGLPGPDDEELRRTLYGSDAPPDVPAQMDWGFLSLLPDRASQGEFQKLITSLEQWLMHGPEAPARAMVLEDLPVAFEPRLFLRGNPNRPGEPVARRFLTVLDSDGRPFTRGSGRLELAQAIVNPKNPLTARVFVNRIWAHHFGEGLVRTPSDFGTRSEPPSHPELLDWLAADLVQGQWSVKRLHRLIMNSAVYQQRSQGIGARGQESGVRGQGSEVREESVSVDPENRLLSHFPRRRHDFETQRDALLAVSGKLDGTMGGPPADLNSSRRTLYTFVNRMDVPPVMTAFDFPSPSASCPQRVNTTVAPQALYLMNNAFVAEGAEAMLRRAEIANAKTLVERVSTLYKLVYGRPPTETDTRRAEEFLGAEPKEKAWQHYVHALLLANEFVFVD